MKTKLIGGLLTILISMAVTKAFAYDIAVENEDVTIYYNYIYYGTQLEVTYKEQNSASYSGRIVIPEKVTYSNTTYRVTRIGDKAFYGCRGLTSITIPENVTSIGDDAFYNCSSLTSVTIPKSVTSLGYSVFSSCGGLTSVTIPEGVTSISNRAFYFCEGLTSIDIPSTVTSIGVAAFEGCFSLTSVIIPNGVTSIDNSTFNNCRSLTSIIIPESVTSIGDFAFMACRSLTSVTIPKNVTLIGNNSFSRCSSLSSVTIPEGVTSIRSRAFEGCISLISVTIPNSVTSIGDYAFYGCSGLTTITIGESIETIGNRTFSNCQVLKDVYCYSDNVPTTNSYSFTNSLYNNATLHVPITAIDNYRTTQPWNEFNTIVGFGTEPIAEITTNTLQTAAMPIMIKAEDGIVSIEGAENGMNVSICTIDGVHEGSATIRNGSALVNTNIPRDSVTIVKIDNKSVKVVMR